MKKTPVTFATHFDAFLAYAEMQPGDREIDHHGDWCGCAIGDFHREANSIPPKGDGVDGNDNEALVISPLLVELETDHAYIAEALNSREVPNCISEESEEEGGKGADGYEINTYRGLARFMRAYKGMGEDEYFDDCDVPY